MTKSLVQKTIPIGNSTLSAQPHMADPAWRAWQGHVDFGNIGSGNGTTAEQRARHARNERVLCGRRVPRIWES